MGSGPGVLISCVVVIYSNRTVNFCSIKVVRFGNIVIGVAVKEYRHKVCMGGRSNGTMCFLNFKTS